MTVKEIHHSTAEVGKLQAREALKAISVRTVWICSSTVVTMRSKAMAFSATDLLFKSDPLSDEPLCGLASKDSEARAQFVWYWTEAVRKGIEWTGIFREGED